jgi:hypothetical protein
VGRIDGEIVGSCDGNRVGFCVGRFDGDFDGVCDGSTVGAGVVGYLVGSRVGC